MDTRVGFLHFEERSYENDCMGFVDIDTRVGFLHFEERIYEEDCTGFVDIVFGGDDYGDV